MLLCLMTQEEQQAELAYRQRMMLANAENAGDFFQYSISVSVGSRPSDHYFRCVCLFVCAEFFSAVFYLISIKLGHMLCVWV